jgi:hypothetical protein
MTGVSNDTPETPQQVLLSQALLSISSSPFFHLPRELRDEIYHHTFNNTPTTFQHRELVVLATHGFPKYTDSSTPTQGLPSWLLSCRLILIKAMQHFGTTRVITAIAYYRSENRQNTFCSLSHPPGRFTNPLVFNPEVLRTIAIYPNFSENYGAAIATKQFFFVLRCLDTNDISLEMA